jgi:hypothetical protein
MVPLKRRQLGSDCLSDRPDEQSGVEVAVAALLTNN